MRLDGQILSGVTWYEVSGSSLSYTMINIPVGQHLVDHVNTDIKMAAFIYGHATYESYGMQAGALCRFIILIVSPEHNRSPEQSQGQPRKCSFPGDLRLLLNNTKLNVF